MNDEEDVRSNANNSRYDRQSSISGNSRKGGEELLESLKKMDENGPHYYQSEIKRFESIANKNQGSLEEGGTKTVELELIPALNPGSTAPLIRQQSGSNRKKRYFQTLGQSGVVDKASVLIKKRKLCRLFTLIGLYSILIGVSVFLFFFGSKTDRRVVNMENKDIRLNIENCRLFIEPCDPCSETSINLDYRSSINKIFSRVLNEESFSFAESDTSVTYSVKHYDDIKGCNLQLQVPRSLTLQSLHVACEGNCVLIQRQKEFSTKQLVVTGGSVSVNMAKVTVGNLAVNITTGYFQVNHLLFANNSSYSRSILLGMGDIVLHTNTSLNADFITASENYCFSGFSSFMDTGTTKTTIALPLKMYVTQAHLHKGYFQSQWQGKYNICNSAGCGSTLPSIKLYNFDGNIFINVMESIPSLVSSTASIVKGSRYGTLVDISEDAKADIIKYQEMTVQTSLPNLILRLAFGNTQAWSTHGSNWVYTDHALYSIIKPWWISFFSLGFLVSNTNDVSTYLSPGFCPYRHSSTILENMALDTAIRSHINGTSGVLNFLKPATQLLVPDPTKPNDGFTEFATFAQFSDEWVQIQLLAGQNYHYKAILLTENIDTFLLIVASIAVTLLIALRMTYILIKLLFKSYQVVRERLYHMEFYWKIYSKVANSGSKNTIAFNIDEEDNDRLQNTSLKNVNVNLTRSYFDLPSTTAFVDYLIIDLWVSKSSSLNRFYKIAFEEANHEKIVDFEMQNLQRDRVPLKTLKSLYQQLCFLMGYKEDELSSTESISILNKRGMVLTDTDSHRQYLIRLTINPVSDFSLSFLKNDKKQSSLQIFLEKFCQQTNFDEDKIAFDDFDDHYTRFCKLNHMEPVLIDHILLKNEFGIESRTYLKEMVEREKDFDQWYLREENLKAGWYARFKRAVTNLFSKRAFYNLKVERIKNVNLFLAGKLNEADVGKEEYNRIINLAILEDYWYINDLRAVLLELVINSVLSAPFISIFIFQEIEHSSYSLRDESINIYGFNFNSNDIWLLPQKVKVKVDTRYPRIPLFYS